MKKILFPHFSIFFLIFSFLGLLPNFAKAAEPIKILLVPGHDNTVWGAQYKTIKEADMNVALALKIYNLLKLDKRFQVHITRDWNGYTPLFAEYFREHQNEIYAFKENSKKVTQGRLSDGSLVERENPPHNNASESVAMTLYGINLWADDNQMDAVIHIHFNDYPRPDASSVGVYKGFAIYMPESQMDNSPGSTALAGSIFTELRKKYIPSTYPEEKGGLVPDQSLIALGSNGSLLSSVRSTLIEYGYIYRFGDYTMRHRAYTNMASLTVAGIKKYFF